MCFFLSFRIHIGIRLEHGTTVQEVMTHRIWCNLETQRLAHAWWLCKSIFHGWSFIFASTHNINHDQQANNWHLTLFDFCLPKSFAYKYYWNLAWHILMHVLRFRKQIQLKIIQLPLIVTWYFFFCNSRGQSKYGDKIIVCGTSWGLHTFSWCDSYDVIHVFNFSVWNTHSVGWYWQAMSSWVLMVEFYYSPRQRQGHVLQSMFSGHFQLLSDNCVKSWQR